VLATKVPDEDATFLAGLARSAGITKSELVRRIITERIRREQGPPDDGGGQSTTPDNDPG
jgi:hypothetical protein